MLKLPEIKKVINKFLTSEDGKISKKAVIGIGALIALAASVQKVKADCPYPGVWGYWPYDAPQPEPGYVMITKLCVNAGRHLNDSDSCCDQGMVFWCHDVSHKNSLQIVPKTGELIATHSHSLLDVPVHSNYYWSSCP